MSKLSELTLIEWRGFLLGKGKLTPQQRREIGRFRRSQERLERLQRIIESLPEPEFEPLPNPAKREDFWDFEKLRLNTTGWRILLQQRESTFQRQLRESAVCGCRRITSSLTKPEPFSELEPIPTPSFVIHHRVKLKTRRRS